jgi:hypothetical protein
MKSQKMLGESKVQFKHTATRFWKKICRLGASFGNMLKHWKGYCFELKKLELPFLERNLNAAYNLLWTL